MHPTMQLHATRRNLHDLRAKVDAFSKRTYCRGWQTASAAYMSIDAMKVHSLKSQSDALSL